MSLSPYSKEAAISLGKMQDLMTEALDGFVLVALGDGTIVYVSENIHKYLGLFQVHSNVHNTCIPISYLCVFMYN